MTGRSKSSLPPIAPVRDTSLDALCRGAGTADLLEECEALDTFRRRSDNLYQRVRALFFLYALHRFHLPQPKPEVGPAIPFSGYTHLLKRRFEEAIDTFLAARPRWSQRRDLAAPWRGLSKPSRSRRWPTRCAAAYAPCAATNGCSVPPIPRIIRCGFARTDRARRRRIFPVLHEATPVRMDLTQSGWSEFSSWGWISRRARAS